MHRSGGTKGNAPSAMLNERQHVSSTNSYKKKKVELQSGKNESSLPTEAYTRDGSRSCALLESALRVELEFCLRLPPSALSFAARRETAVSGPYTLQEQYAMFTPRDLGNLLLWSVPSAIPLIEAPREFFIRSKSRLRNVVMIYVNGWSFDMMMATGAGLPRGSAQEGGKEITPTHRDDDNPGGSNPCEKNSETPPFTKWSGRICQSLLKPIRTGMCWARAGQGRDSCGGVQYAPLAIRSIKNEFEKELFWRNDAPKIPKDSFSSQSSTKVESHTASELCEEKTKLATTGHLSEAFSHEANVSYKDTTYIDSCNKSESTVRGVGGAFKRARILVGGKPPDSVPPPDHPASTAGCAGCGPSTDDTREKAADVAQRVGPTGPPTLCLWDKREYLLKFALHLPEHEVELKELGFVLEKPKREPAAETRATSKSRIASEGGSEACDIAEEDSDWALFSTSEEDSEDDQDGMQNEPRHAEKLPRVFALDCEMVMTKGRVSSLARATLVDARSKEVVFDMLVKPRTEIIDYLTRFSGIKERTLHDVTNTLVNCQAALKKHIRSSDFVVGHSLENDFKACQMIPNCYVLDTAWLFPHPTGLPYKNSLRYLALRYLDKRIQQGSHDSALDAQTSVELVQLKLVKGPSFGIRCRVSVLGLMSGDPTPSGASQPGTAAKSSQGPAVSVRLFDDAEVLAGLLPKQSALIDTVPVRHDRDAVRKIVAALHRRGRPSPAATAANRHSDGSCDPSTAAAGEDDYAFMWVQLRETAVDVRAAPSADPNVASEAEVEQLRRVEEVNRRVLQVIEACPDETLVVVVAADCKGEAGGNHFSRAQGACFGFIKDHTAAGPPASTYAMESNSDSTQPPCECGIKREGNGKSAMRDLSAAAKLGTEMPPACQQQ